MQLMAQPAAQRTDGGPVARFKRTESAPAASMFPLAAGPLAAQPDELPPPLAPRPVMGLRLGAAKSTSAGDAATPTPRGSKTPRAEPGASAQCQLSTLSEDCDNGMLPRLPA